MHFFNIKGDDDDVDDNEETDDDYDQYDTSESDHENAIPTNIIKIKHFKNEHLDELEKNRNLSRDKPALGIYYFC
jgi:hypothetical protein